MDIEYRDDEYVSEEENKDDVEGGLHDEEVEEDEDNILKGTNTKKERIKRNFGNCWVFCFKNGEPLFTIGPHCFFLLLELIYFSKGPFLFAYGAHLLRLE